MLNAAAEPYQDEPFEAEIAIRTTRRVRHSPLTRAALRRGASGWTVYNHMLLPTSYRGIEDYHHLKRAVQVWDVCAERQVEITGPDAAELAQLLTPRRVLDWPLLKCAYAPCCDANGGLLNDPLLLRPDEKRWWFSIADTDLLLFATGIAAGRGLDVAVREPDVHPIAIQGPKADELAARVFGDAVRDLRFFGADRFEVEGREHVVARSGWSGQGGFEVFVEGWDACEPLWDALFEAGADLDVRPGSPNAIERIEAGLLSYGNDMTLADTPFECGLGRYVDLDAPSLARDALRERAEPTRALRGLMFEAGSLPTLARRWPVERDGNAVGEVRSAANSPDHARGIAIAMLDHRALEEEATVQVHVPGVGPMNAEVRKLPMKI